MRQTQKEIIKFIRTILTEHDTYWEDKNALLKKFKNAYEGQFWSEDAFDSSMIQVETSDCYSFVEGFQSSLFTKNPAVVIARDPANLNGNPLLAQEATNRWLFHQRTQIEIASRLAIIYPNSFLKLSPKESDEMLNKVSIRALAPWEVIVDTDASEWHCQRFCGHIYYLPLAEAKMKYGNKDWKPQAKADYFDTQKIKKENDLPDEYLYIKIVEEYDLNYDKQYIWTPNLTGDKG